ncbi:MAG: twin-arginine translocation signal domain-containing protein [Pirellulales bacterium]|nr:twin-arginine translocation signal domain-containing protein [Pirellulales bacterium]
MTLQTNRRNFLRLAAGAGLVGGLSPFSRSEAGTAPFDTTLPDPEQRKLILVVFGGGTRFSESIGDPEHRYIPHLWKEMVPRGTLLTNMRVEHLVVHPNCTASIKTGHWEWDDLDWSRPPAHPTIFEIYRKRRQAPDTAAWSFVYASILAQTGLSTAADYGRRYAANVVEPPTIPRATDEEMDRLMARAAAAGSPEEELKAAATCARLARQNSRVDIAGLQSPKAKKWFDEQYQAWRGASGSTSHDAFLAGCATACMRKFSPGVMSVDFGEIDCAHYGSWSRYVEAIRRTDDLTWKLWKAAEELPDYRGKTMMLILPDHGRELDRPGGPGFIHHSDFYTNQDADEGCRRVWMLALGPGVPSGQTVARPVPITAAATTGLHYLGLPPSKGAARSAFDASG